VTQVFEESRLALESTCDLQLNSLLDVGQDAGRLRELPKLHLYLAIFIMHLGHVLLQLESSHELDWVNDQMDVFLHVLQVFNFAFREGFYDSIPQDYLQVLIPMVQFKRHLSEHLQLELHYFYQPPDL